MKTKDRKHLTLVYNQKVCDDSITITFYKEKNISNNYSGANRKKCIVVKRSIADVMPKCVFLIKTTSVKRIHLVYISKRFISNKY